MHPFLDVTKLSDEEIIERLGKAYTFMNFQKSVGHMPAVVSIREVITALEEERSTRMQKVMADEVDKKYPDSNKPIELGKIEN